MSFSTAPVSQEQPVFFDEFFELGGDDSKSPFLTPESRAWGVNLTLKAAILAAFLLVIAFALSFSPGALPLSNLLIVSVFFLAGIPSLIEALEDVASYDINIDILMTVAAFSSVLIGSQMEGALLLVLFALSGAMEDAVTAKAKSSISDLNKLAPTRACVIESDGTLIERSIKDLSLNTRILVRAGQIVPLDGVVVEGASTVNLVHLTGENFPVTKKVEDEVPAGARNLDGTLTLVVTHTSADSTLSKIIELVTQAQESRPKLQRWFDKLSRTYAITIILLSLLFALVFPFLFAIPFLGVEGSVYRALAFLIAASPCALIIAIPIAYLSAVSVCARKGILIKGGITLDALASCKAIALDKTGTLTTGDLTCESIEGISHEPLDGETRKRVLSIAYALEKNAIHPIAKSIVSYAEKQGLTSPLITDFKSIPGHGLNALLGNVAVSIGQPDFIAVKLPEATAKVLKSKCELMREKGELVAAMLIGQEPYLFRFRDTIRPKIKEALQLLKHNQKLTMVMLTGDHELSAKRVATELGIDEYHADLTPKDKLDYVTALSQEKGLAMVGDGVNDAPALARATAGICMGKVGSTTAMDAADAILLHDNIEHLDWLFAKARQTQAIVKQNLFLAASAILIASIPALMGWVPLWLAVVMHEGGTVLVGLNALRLLRK